MKPIFLTLASLVGLVCAPAAFGTSISFDDPTVTSVDNFGAALAVEGDWLLIGAPGDDAGGVTNTGQVYLFDASTNSLLHTFNDPNPGVGSGFGSAVAIDGNRVLIGAPGSGAAYLFDFNLTGVGGLLGSGGGSWRQAATFNDPSAGSSDFGSAVALDGSRVLIGAGGDDSRGFLNVGRAYLYDASGLFLPFVLDDPTVTTADGFGTSVAIDGDTIVIGAPGDDTAGLGIGQAHVFDANDLAAGPITIDDPTPTTFDEFGTSVAVEGTSVVVGAPNHDSLTATDVGQAHLFDGASGGVLQVFDDPSPGGFDRFGAAVSVEGARVLVGAAEEDTPLLNAGQAHLFVTATGQLLDTLDAPTGFISGNFGAAVSLSGGNAIVGAPGDDSNGANVGRAYLFDNVQVIIPEPSAALLAVMACVAGAFRCRNR